jgi:hypothetical protein
MKVATDGTSAKIEFTLHVVRDGDSTAAIIVPYEIFRDTLDARSTSRAGPTEPSRSRRARP